MAVIWLGSLSLFLLWTTFGRHLTNVNCTRVARRSHDECFESVFGACSTLFLSLAQFGGSAVFGNLIASSADDTRVAGVKCATDLGEEVH